MEDFDEFELAYADELELLREQEGKPEIKHCNLFVTINF